MRARRHRCASILTGVAIALAVAWTLFPFYWALIASLKPESLEFRAVYLPFIDFHPTLEHWRWEWHERHQIDGLQDGLLNSAIVALATTLLSVAVGLPAAAGLHRLRRAGRWTGAATGLFVLPRIVPPVVVVIPLFLLMTATGLHDTRTALTLMHTMLALPLAVLVLDGALRELPRDLLDAARLDGANGVRLLLQIVAPLLRQMLLAVGTLSFALSWNEFMLAQTNHKARAFTAPISVAFLQDRDGVQFAHVGSHLVLIVLPPLLLGLFAQRFLVRGLSLGAIRADR